MTTAKLYYESHITIEPIENPRLLRDVEIACDVYKFRVAALYMLKDRKETPERSNRDTFMTGHGVDLKDLTCRMKNLIKVLQRMGIKVWRYKIEDTVLDSRFTDELNLL